MNQLLPSFNEIVEVKIDAPISGIKREVNAVAGIIALYRLPDPSHPEADDMEVISFGLNKDLLSCLNLVEGNLVPTLLNVPPVLSTALFSAKFDSNTPIRQVSRGSAPKIKVPLYKKVLRFIHNIL